MNNRNFVTVSPAFSTPALAPSVASSLHKPFVIGPGYSPIPAKLVTKLRAGQFVDLADLLPENVKAQDSEPQSYLDGKLLVSTKKRVREITDIVTWVEAFTVYMWIFCCTHSSRWQDMTQYKLLILQTARQFSDKAWLHYDTAFRKDAAAAAVRSVKESILVSTVPFGPQRHMFSPRGLLPLRGANARGVETVTKMSTSPVNNVNNVEFCRSSSLSHSLFPVPVNVVASSAHIPPTSSRPQGLPAQTPLSSSCLVASTCQQDLVLPSRVTPIDVQKLWHELCFHPEQVKVDYVISGLMNGSRLGFDPSAVSLQSAVHNMPSASLQPSVIDQYLRLELEKGRVAGPFLISPIPNLHVSRFGVIPKKCHDGKSNSSIRFYKIMSYTLKQTQSSNNCPDVSLHGIKPPGFQPYVLNRIHVYLVSSFQ